MKIPGALINENIRSSNYLNNIPYPSRYDWVSDICNENYEPDEAKITIPSIKL